MIFACAQIMRELTMISAWTVAHELRITLAFFVHKDSRSRGFTCLLCSCNRHNMIADFARFSHDKGMSSFNDHWLYMLQSCDFHVFRGYSERDFSLYFCWCFIRQAWVNLALSRWNSSLLGNRIEDLQTVSQGELLSSIVDVNSMQELLYLA